MKKKIKKDKDFYINKIKVIEWLESSGGNQIHRFRDRLEYKKNYNLHREDGPAIEYNDNLNNKYYIEGERYTEDEFTNYKRNKILNDALR